MSWLLPQCLLSVVNTFTIHEFICTDLQRCISFVNKRLLPVLDCQCKLSSSACYHTPPLVPLYQWIHPPVLSLHHHSYLHTKALFLYRIRMTWYVYRNVLDEPVIHCRNAREHSVQLSSLGVFVHPDSPGLLHSLRVTNFPAPL